MTTRFQLIDEARTWQGVKWRHLGRGRGGVDCAGFLVCVAQAMSLEYVDLKVYSHTPDGSELRAAMDTCLDRVPHGKQRPGDIALMRFGTDPIHMGILTDTYPNMGIIHAHALHRMVIEHPYTGEFVARTSLYYSFRGLED